MQSSGTFVSPIMMAPFSLNKWMATLSSSAITSLRSTTPAVLWRPRKSKLFLLANLTYSEFETDVKCPFLRPLDEKL